MEHSNSSFSFSMKKTIVVNYCQLLYIPFQFIFPDQEQFHEEVGCYHPDGNPAWRNAKHGRNDFYFLSPKRFKRAIISDNEKVGRGSIDDARLPDNCWPCLLLLDSPCQLVGRQKWEIHFSWNKFLSPHRKIWLGKKLYQKKSRQQINLMKDESMRENGCC